VHNWRDFLTHLIIVTIGLFIALMMEAGVELIHHRHLVREARENIRTELQTNHDAAQQDLQLMQQAIDRQKSNIANIRSLSTEGKNFHGTVSNTLDYDSFDDAAWRTARDTGALGYMPYAEIQRYSDVYMLAEIVNKQAVEAGERDFLAAAPFKTGLDPDKLDPADYKKMLNDNAAVEIELIALRQYVQQYDALCVAELKK
jgi:hypothetical protein